MDRERTGALIAAARKENGMTQRDLAAALHVSDRAVSKWERGAGFPDVSLLEPLAAALGVNVLDLLRGERTEGGPDVTVREAIALLVRQTREQTRRRWGQLLGTLAALVLLGFVLLGILDRAGVFLRSVSLEVAAAVYVDGEPLGETTVTVEGERKIIGEKSFVGRFAIGCVEATCREGMSAQIRWDAMEAEGFQDILYSRRGEFLTLGVERLLYISENMRSFGLRLEDGTVIATDDFYVPLLLSGYYYSIRPVVSNQF